MLRLNLLEMMNHSRVFISHKRYSTADFMVHLDKLYQFAQEKPDKDYLDKALAFLINRKLINKSKIGSVYMYGITERGRETLQRIADGDDTVIY